MASKIIQSVMIIFLYLFFGIILKILNIIKFAIIFKIIYYYIIFSIGCINDKFFNFAFLFFKIRLNQKKTNSIILSINKLALIIFNNNNNNHH